MYDNLFHIIKQNFIKKKTGFKLAVNSVGVPSQLVPFPVQPVLQEHENEPRVLVQFAWSWQSSRLCVHSSTSKVKQLQFPCDNLWYNHNLRKEIYWWINYGCVPWQLVPFPVQPVKQRHEYDPGMMMHDACSWQSSGKCRHSSNSKVEGLPFIHQSFSQTIFKTNSLLKNNFCLRTITDNSISSPTSVTSTCKWAWSVGAVCLVMTVIKIKSAFVNI